MNWSLEGLLNRAQLLFRRAPILPRSIEEIADVELRKAERAIEERASIQYRAPSEFGATFDREGHFTGVYDPYA